MKIVQHLSAMVIVTIIMGLIYGSVQQTYRSNANDPQMQVAYDLRDHLERGQSLLFDDTVDLERSLSLFKETYDENGRPIQSTGFLNGRTPQLPKGVFGYANNKGEHWLTWQPKPGVRLATGIIRVHAAPVAYLVIGRSLREAEERVSGLIKMVFTAWLLCISVICVNWLVTYYQHRKNSNVL
jgi:hypothetical protein